MRYMSIVLVIVAIAAASPALAAQTENLLKNPDFEIQGDSQEKAADWDVWMGERLNEFKQSGDWSVHSWAFDGDGDGGAWQASNISAGTKVFFKGYIMSPKGTGMHNSPLAGGAKAFLEIEWWQGDTKLGSVKSTEITGASDWALHSATGVAPAGTNSVRFVAKVVSITGSSGDVYFDNLQAGIAQ